MVINYLKCVLLYMNTSFYNEFEDSVSTGHCGHPGLKKKGRGELDVAAIEYVKSLSGRGFKPNIVELGCGDGLLAAKLVDVGAAVFACDIIDNLNAAAREVCATGNMVTVIQPMQRLSRDQLPSPIDGLVAQRSLHWLSYKDAGRVLKKIAERMPDGASLFVSLAGLDSPLGRSYPFNEKTRLSRRYAQSHRVDGFFGHKCTLYSGEEAKGFVEDRGFKVTSIRSTRWGLWNIKAVRSKPVRTAQNYRTHPASRYRV